MEDQNVITAQLRTVTGKRVKTLRTEGLIPLVVYGPKTEPINIQAVEFDTKRAIARAGGQLITLQIEGEQEPRVVLARDVQRDAISGNLVHADLYEVDITERLQVEVPLTFVGEPQLVTTGEALVLTILTSVEIECLPTEIMQSIEVDVSGLVEFTDAVYVSDLALPEGIEMLTPADEMIARLEAVEEEEEEEEEELFPEVEPGEVEVIQRGRAEEEGEEEEEE
jgi:large subunit ribosomal protein L25